MEDVLKPRYSVKYQQPNPLFVQWLTDWRDEAIENDSNMQRCFTKALESLRKYPLPLETGKDCSILNGFGTKLCKMLDDKLAEHRAANPGTIGNIYYEKRNNSPPPEIEKSKKYVPAYRSGAYAILVTLYKESLKPDYKGYLLKMDITKLAKPLCDKSFTKPDPGTWYTAWSSMKTLLDKHLVKRKGCPALFSLTKEGITLGRQLYQNSLRDYSDEDDENTCTSNFSQTCGRPAKNLQARKPEKITSDNMGVTSYNAPAAPIITTHYPTPSTCISHYPTASTITSHYPIASTSKINYPTTATIISNMANECTFNLADPCKETRNVQKASEIPPSSSCSSSQSSASVQFESFIFAPNTFDIGLLVDTQETVKKNLDPREDPLLAGLLHLNVNYEVRHLKVGDYTWVARERASGKELVLPYIIERKRFDDLAASIKDGRFHEQKFRLKQSGIQNLIYLVESYGDNKHAGLPLRTLHQAATNTLVQDKFCLKYTESMKGTIEYLSCMTSIIEKLFKGKTLMSCPKKDLAPFNMEDDLIPLMIFEEFNKSSSKNKDFTVQDLFIKNLLQLKSISLEKALAIIEVYPTPRRLRVAYKNLSKSEGEKLLSSIKFGKLKKNIGPIISKTVYQLYNMPVYSG